jgi:hypothetical protein
VDFYPHDIFLLFDFLLTYSLTASLTSDFSLDPSNPFNSLTQSLIHSLATLTSIASLDQSNQFNSLTQSLFTYSLTHSLNGEA